MKIRRFVLGLSLVLMMGCSAQTMQALKEEQENGAHFASWSHMGYSLRRGTPETTTKADIERSKKDQCAPNQTCKWWGEVVMLQPIQ